MIRPVVRALLLPAAIAVALALAGCNANDVDPTGRAMAPLSPQTLALIKSKNMDRDSPILVRVFKQEAVLEVWKMTRDGTYALLKTYPICRWSGKLGPKKKQGDRQAPEGFYTITPAQMNPNSNYYLAFNTGYPNTYDRSHGYSGSELMVHGDCSSAGCYAMTDKQIQEIYALARDAFYGGQREFQFEAFPFRMTALNMARHRNNPNFAFWKMLKRGYDDFEATHLEPLVDVCDRHYVFDAAAPAGDKRPLIFHPRGRCPVYRLNPMVASAVLNYRMQQQVKMANYIAEDVATAPPHVGDGGTNPVFASTLLTPSHDGSGNRYEIASLEEHPPGALPHVPNPPGTTIPQVGKDLHQQAAKTAKEPAQETASASQPTSAPPPAGQPIAMTRVPLPEPAPLPKTGTAPQQPRSIASLFGHLFQAPPPQAAPAETETANAAPEGAAINLRGSKGESAAKPAATARVRTASAPIVLHPKPHKERVVAHNPPRHERTARNERAVRIERTAHNEHATPKQAERQAPASVWPPIKRIAKSEKPAAKQVAKTEKPAAKHLARKEPSGAPVIRTAFSSPSANGNGLLTGAQPVIPAGSFALR